ncbi:hypothetical protein ACFB49_09150 [Sphingomonas sp. DBB INV C78]
MPWKNGGGVTHEVAIFPNGAGLNDFQWRLSMAEVREPGPFSAFAGIDRVLAVLEGRLRLSGESVGTVELTAATAPLAFPGDATIQGEPLDGPVLDLNAMTRRNEWRTEMIVLEPGEHAVAASRAILVATAPIQCAADGRSQPLERLDCLLLEDVERLQWSAGTAILVRFLPIPLALAPAKP